MSTNRDISQSSRLLSFEGNPAFDLLIPTHFIGTEGLSELFNFAISGYCKDINLRLETLLHSAVALKLNDGQQERYFHGYVSEVEDFSVTGHNQRRFRITLKPQLWFLSKVQVCAIHHNQTIPELVGSILKSYGIQNVNLGGLKQSYQPKETCTQYNESVLNFVLRLLEEAGIDYYFSHENNQHGLNLLDNLHSLPSLPGTYDYRNTQQDGLHIHNWQSQVNLVSSAVSLNDYNYEDPSANLITEMKSHGTKAVEGMTNAAQAAEIYEYAQGDHRVFSLGQRHSNQQLNQAQSKQEVNLGSGNAMTFSGGYQFQFKHLEDGQQTGQYRLTQIQHQAHDHSHIAHDDEGKHLNLPEPFGLHTHIASTHPLKLPKPFASPNPEDPPTQSYQNHFRAVSSLKRYSPRKRYQKPRIHGHHHALVIGPKGKAIHTDSQGRIKVGFPWDANSDTNNKETQSNASWIRVLQNQTGEGFGTGSIPRIGHEVIIGYQEGDIDRPICLGSCYNESQQPAYSLPESQHLSGLKTRTLGSQNQTQGHELQFNDLPGKENLTIKAQNQLSETINHDANHTIGNAFTEKVQGNKTTTIKGSGTFESPKNITLMAGGGQISIDPNKITIQGQVISMGEPGAVQTGSSTQELTGPHWIGVRYKDSNGKAMANMPVSIITDDGKTHSGQLNSGGEYTLKGIHGRNAKIIIGDKQKLEQTLLQQRTQLKTSLDKILASSKLEHANNEAKLNQQSYFNRMVSYINAAGGAFDAGTIHAVKATGVGIIDLFKDMAKVQQADDEGMAGVTTHNAHLQQQARNEVSQVGQSEYGPALKALQVIHLLYRDKPTRKLLENFAESYWQSDTKLAIVKQSSEVLGGAVPTILAAIVLKEPGAFPAAAEGSGTVAEAAEEFTEINKTLDELEKVKEIPAAEVDREHELTLDDPVLEAAEPLDKGRFLKGYKIKPGEELPHPAGSKHNIDFNNTQSFHGKPKPIVLKPGTKIYRIIQRQEDSNGRYWAYELPKSKVSWRRLFAVKQPWNKNGYYVEYVVPDGEGVPAWDGVTASQEFGYEGYPGYMLEGGKTQLFIADSQNLIPEDLNMLKTMNIWEK